MIIRTEDCPASSRAVPRDSAAQQGPKPDLSGTVASPTAPEKMCSARRDRPAMGSSDGSAGSVSDSSSLPPGRRKVSDGNAGSVLVHRREETPQLEMLPVCNQEAAGSCSKQDRVCTVKGNAYERPLRPYRKVHRRSREQNQFLCLSDPGHVRPKLGWGRCPGLLFQLLLVSVAWCVVLGKALGCRRK